MEPSVAEFSAQSMDKASALKPEMPVQAVAEPGCKIINGRYKKIKTIGKGSFNSVSLVQDLYPNCEPRLLSQKHLDMIEKLPRDNPYQQMSYFDYDDDQPTESEEEKAIKNEMKDFDLVLPHNAVHAAKALDQADFGSKSYLALKKQLNMMYMKGGFEFTLLREVKLLQVLDHPNVVKLRDVFHDKGLLYFAIEYGSVNLSDLVASKKV